MTADEKMYLIRAIRDCGSEFHKEPEPGMRQDRFKIASLEQWACNEVIDIISESDNPIRDLNLFAIRTSKWMMSGNLEIAKTFSILNDAVEFAIDLINGMKGD